MSTAINHHTPNHHGPMRIGGAIPPPPHPDAELIRLGRELDEISIRQAEAIANAKREQTEEAEDFADAVMTSAFAIVAGIEALSASTVAGLQVKYRALVWCYDGAPVTEEVLEAHPHPWIDRRLVVGILQDLSAMRGALA
jgi:hypothetical protein